MEEQATQEKAAEQISAQRASSARQGAEANQADEAWKTMRCSDFGNEALPGTAKSMTLFLAVEYLKGWARDIMDDDVLGDLTAPLKKVLKDNGASMQFIRKPGRAGQFRDERKIYIARTDQGTCARAWLIWCRSQTILKPRNLTLCRILLNDVRILRVKNRSNVRCWRFSLQGPLGELTSLGGLPRGAATSIADCSTALVQIIAQVTAAGKHVAVIGPSDLLWAAVSGAGGDLSLIAVVDCPDATGGADVSAPILSACWVCCAKGWALSFIAARGKQMCRHHWLDQ